MRFGTPCSNAYILKHPIKKRSFTIKIIYLDFFVTITSMQQEQLVAHYPILIMGPFHPMRLEILSWGFEDVLQSLEVAENRWYI